MKAGATSELGRSLGLPEQSLTEIGSLRLEYCAPPSDVAPYVTSFFRMCSDEREIRDVQLASVGVLAVFVRGKGEIRFLNGRVDPTHPLVLLAPTSAAAQILVEGPWHAFGAALSPVGWAAITWLSPARHANRLYDGAILGPAFAAAAEQVAAGFDCLSNDALGAILGETIVAAARPLPDGHVKLLEAVSKWLGESLSPRVPELAARVGYSPRQTQRLIDRYFGLPPKVLARKYRALRAAALLADPQTTADEIAAIQNHFYDRKHMIREIWLFCGRAPSKIADTDAPYLSALLNLRNFREIARVAPLPGDLHA